jgi:hypothetical protein
MPRRCLNLVDFAAYSGNSLISTLGGSEHSWVRCCDVKRTPQFPTRLVGDVTGVPVIIVVLNVVELVSIPFGIVFGPVNISYSPSNSGLLCSFNCMEVGVMLSVVGLGRGTFKEI